MRINEGKISVLFLECTMHIYVCIYKYTKFCAVSRIKLRIGLTRNGVLSERLNRLVNTVTNFPNPMTHRTPPSVGLVRLHLTFLRRRGRTRRSHLFHRERRFKRGSCLKINRSCLLAKEKNYSPMKFTLW